MSFEKIKNKKSFYDDTNAITRNLISERVYTFLADDRAKTTELSHFLLFISASRINSCSYARQLEAKCKRNAANVLAKSDQLFKRKRIES